MIGYADSALNDKTYYEAISNVFPPRKPISDATVAAEYAFTKAARVTKMDGHTPLSRESMTGGLPLWAMLNPHATPAQYVLLPCNEIRLHEH